MIIFIGGAGSRLGNQIFQYVFIKSIAAENEILLTSGFETLMEVFNVHGLINITQKQRIVKRFLFKIIVPILIFIGKIRLITVIGVDYKNINGNSYESDTCSYKNGLLKFIKYVRYGFFQSESFFKREAVNSLEIKHVHIRQAELFLGDIPADTQRIFIHIRRGDYKNFRIFDKSTLLPMEYYKDQIEFFINNYKKCHFVFLSDDPDFTEEQFGYLANKKIARNHHHGTDFAIITKCNGGILSTSTFGWWAAYMIENKGHIFAPKYWLGFNSGIEFPEKGFPSFAREVEINKDPEP